MLFETPSKGLNLRINSAKKIMFKPLLNPFRNPGGVPGVAGAPPRAAGGVWVENRRTTRDGRTDERTPPDHPGRTDGQKKHRKKHVKIL